MPYVVRVNQSWVGGAEPLYRYIGRDGDGYHTGPRAKAHLFSTRAEAEDALDAYRQHPGSDPVIEWVGPAVPDWLEKGARVCLPGGPAWTVVEVVEGEVTLNYPGDDQPVVWGLERFLLAWVRVRMSRFDRDEPI